jgi:hypothetical protein
MITIRKEKDRGKADHGWLKANHSFSFADYYDPQWVQFRNLRVLNEDNIAPKTGFPRHPHNDMEIITYVLEGSLQHEDSMGNRAIIQPGEIQVMHAGTGIFHSEKNPADEELHLLQIWIMPDKAGHEPGYEQGVKLNESHQNKLTIAASFDGRDNSPTIHADASLFVGRYDSGMETEFVLEKDRHAWVQVTRGKINLNGYELSPGDGAAVSEVEKLKMEAIDSSEFLLFDLR